MVLSDDCSSERALWRIKDEGSGQYSFINKANEGTYAYAMSNMGSGSSGAQIKGESYTNATRLRWRLVIAESVDEPIWTLLSSDFLNSIHEPPRKLPDGEDITADNKINETTFDY